MSSRITKAQAFTNGEVGYISWKLDSMIHGCLGFEITRTYPDTPENNTVLPAWVPFKGQSNPDWKPQNTSVWPIQKLSWRDLTLRKRRDQFELRPENVRVQYLIRPIVAYDKNLEEVKSTLPVTYTGKPIRLSYLDEGATTNEFFVGVQYGDIRVTFTNGILATQWLTHALKDAGQTFGDLKKDIKDPENKIRKYLTGDVLSTLLFLVDKAAKNKKASLRMALYELDDDELFEAILANKDKIEIILSNTSKGTNGDWDVENTPQREKLSDLNTDKFDRMFNNSAHIGHNKFVIYMENGKPKSVMTGSTNWTSNGLCAQSNNAVIIDSPELAEQYNEYWELLKTDTADFVVPDPLSASTSNTQGSALRSANITERDTVTLKDGTSVKVWFSPNSMRKTTNKDEVPPDLSEVYSLMRKADKAIFFSVFLPGRANNVTGSEIMTNIITEAISLGRKDKSLMVYGAISDPTAMPNYVNPPKKSADDDDDDTDKPEKKPTPTTYDKGKLHIVRAYNLNKSDIVGEFEAELLSAGHAIIHDKIVVIDPLSENGAVIFGSHNLGFKASYQNDENLLIIKNNPPLVQAFAVHILDIYEHYRFRAIQQELHDEGKAEWDGYLSLSDGWLERNFEKDGKNDLSDYMCG